MPLLRLFILTLGLFFSSCMQADVLFKDHLGNDTPFSTLKGKWVFINYWASWCPSCLEEIPEFNRFYEHHKDTIALFAVNYDGLSSNEQNTLIKRFDIRYPSLIQDPSRELQVGDIRGIPVTFVFNPEGTLEATLYGAQTEEYLNKIMSVR